MLRQVEIPSRSVLGFEKILGAQAVRQLEQMAARLRQRYRRGVRRASVRGGRPSIHAHAGGADNR